MRVRGWRIRRGASRTKRAWRTGTIRTGGAQAAMAAAPRAASRAEVDDDGEKIAPAAPSRNAAALSQSHAADQEPRGSSDQLLTGVARYRQVGDPVGSGSFGWVWIAVDKAVPSAVAHRMIRRADRSRARGHGCV